MDIFFEQLVKIKRSAFSTLFLVLSLLGSAAICVVFFWLSNAYPVLIVGIVAIGYGEWKLLGYFHKEYEYIITNGAIDVDCIIGKSSRKRIVSFESTDIVRIGKYNSKNPPVTDAAEKHYCGNNDNAYYLLVNKNGRKIFLTMSLNARMLEAIKNSVPKNILISVFSEV